MEVRYLVGRVVRFKAVVNVHQTAHVPTFVLPRFSGLFL